MLYKLAVHCYKMLISCPHGAHFDANDSLAAMQGLISAFCEETIKICCDKWEVLYARPYSIFLFNPPPMTSCRTDYVNSPQIKVKQISNVSQIFLEPYQDEISHVSTYQVLIIFVLCCRPNVFGILG